MFQRMFIPCVLSAVLSCGAFWQIEKAGGLSTPRVASRILADSAAADNHPILVELFTSEGCSSCPPADALLLNMDTSQPVPGAQLIVLSEHVDYWDHEGWKDPNSSHESTDRQVAYIQVLGLKTPYTPQIIVDGSSEIVMTNSQQTLKVFQNAVAQPKIPVRVSEVQPDPAAAGILRAHVEVDGQNEKKDADIYVAIALDRVESQVTHGENGGRHLTHVAVVQQITKVAKLQKGASFSQDLKLKLKPGTDKNNIRVVAYVQERGPGRVIGAAMRRSGDATMRKSEPASISQ